MIEIITKINSAVNNFVWGPVMLLLLVGTGVYLTARTGCIQAAKFGYIMRNTVGSLFRRREKRDKDAKNLTPFQAVTTALAGTVGTGNIAGVTGAIFAGGPGAVFWMWFAAFFGMFTKFAEIVLALKYRQVDENGVHYGGPMYYIEKGLGMKWLAVLFSLVAGFACFGIGNISQSSEIAGAMEGLFGMSGLTTGVLLAVVVGIVVLGGVQRIGRVTSYMVPFMAIFYIGAGLAVILLRIDQVPAALASIFTSAFSFEAVGGGVFGYAIMVAMRQGFARGVFSNEAGLGSAPIIAAAAKTKNPAEQALIAMTGTFWSTVVICALTGIVLVSTMIAHPEIQAEVLADPTFYTGAQLASTAFATIPYVGTPILVIGMVSFSYSTILGWSYYGNRCAAYLFGKRAILPYHIVYVLVAFLGAIGVGNVVWTISDIGNALMAIPNIIAILLLSGLICRETKHYVYEGNIEEEDTREIPMISSK